MATYSLCPQQVTRNGHTVAVSTECYTKWPHSRCVHSKLHEMATQSLCPQNVTRNGHVVAVSTASYTKWPQVAVSTECYTKWPHSRCVHRMLHEMATQSPCPQNVTRNGHKSLCPQQVTRNGHTVAVSTECYTKWPHSRCVHRMLHLEPHISVLSTECYNTEPHTSAVSTECYETEPHNLLYPHDIPSHNPRYMTRTVNERSA